MSIPSLLLTHLRGFAGADFAHIGGGQSDIEYIESINDHIVSSKPGMYDSS